MRVADHSTHDRDSRCAVVPERPGLRGAVRGGRRRGARRPVRARRARAVRSRGALRDAGRAAGLHRSRAGRSLGDTGGRGMNRRGMPWTPPLCAVAIAAAIAAPSIAPPAGAAVQAAESAAVIARIMETFARPAVDKGAAVGIAVGVTYRGRPPQFFSYGTANVADGTAVTPDTIFEMGSVTKSFTTALLGDAVLAGRLKLNLPLSRLEALLGPVPRSTGAVTLLNLGDFTAG